MLEYALAYAGRGLAVFPLHSIASGRCTCRHGDCRSPGKHPVTRTGFKEATTEYAKITSWWSIYPWANIGVATGSLSGGLLVIDIDKSETNDPGAISRELAKLYGIESTLEIVTGSGGRHIYLGYDPEKHTLKSTTKGILGPDIHIRADGGYVVAPPSKHISGGDYYTDGSEESVAEAPLPLLAKLLTGTVKAVVSDAPESLFPPAQVREIRSALAFIPADNRDMWLEVGMALHSARAGEQAYGLWVEWSQKSAKFDPVDQRRVWASMVPDQGVTLSTLFFRAKQAGWVDLTEPIAVEVVASAPSIEIPQSDASLFTPPGVLSEITQWILATSQRPQPAFAVNAALCLASVVLGRKVMGSSKLRPNIYLISVGATASGKDHPRTAIKQILEAANLSNLLGGELLASGSALISRLTRTPVCLFQLDEFGLLMHSVQSPRAGRHDTEIMTNLMRLFEASQSYFLTTEYADQSNRPRARLEYPCVVLHATTTPRELYSAFSSSHVVSGHLNRYLIVESDLKRPAKQATAAPFAEVPESITHWIREVGLWRGPGLQGTNPAVPIVIPKTPPAAEVFRLWDKEVDERMATLDAQGLDSLWGRAWAYADKLATICACSGSLESPQVRLEDATWAIAFVRHYLSRTESAVRFYVSDTEFGGKCKAVLRAIAKAGYKGLTERELMRSHPMDGFTPRERSAIIDSLTKAGEVIFAKIPAEGSGRVRMAYIVNAGDKS